MNISENSRVWIYQSNRQLTGPEVKQLEEVLESFTGQWLAHGHPLAAQAAVRYARFIILAVDESRAGATGCSIDKSVNLMKEIETAFSIDLFDRFNIAYRDGEQIASCGRAAFETLIASGKITEDTIVFNNLVQTVKGLNEQWEVPFKESWHQRVFSLPTRV
ncbi:ABC transporter ATPase [Hufsiella ginkgonis]|uniref:ABC transporter ATPase n=1 Tax=Hufsiella ginkgonis TaxID=2695274 RepID=A0A7K1XUL9_9SPHI|nr:ABC transporter ATPase [Hufsiella ginkgonis]MXV14660.1 ABC transporter ATPase [Hufsiella ginkgonis]